MGKIVKKASFYVFNLAPLPSHISQTFDIKRHYVLQKTFINTEKQLEPNQTKNRINDQKTENITIFGLIFSKQAINLDFRFSQHLQRSMHLKKL